MQDIGAIFMARVAEQAERFEDMVEFLKPILKEKGGDFSVEERNLLSVGFKNLIGGKRTAIRTIAFVAGSGTNATSAPFHVTLVFPRLAPSIGALIVS